MGANRTDGAVTASATGDLFSWNGGSEGAWGTAANWMDTTTGADPAASPPGAGSQVTIGTSGGFFPIDVTGSGNCAALTLAASVTLGGAFTAGTLTMASYAAQLDLNAGDTLAVAGNTNVGGGDEVLLNGVGAVLSVQGVFALGSGGSGGDLQLGDGAVLSAATFDAAAQSYITLDAASSIEAGGSAGVAAGSFTVDAGGTADLGGTLIAPALRVDGLLSVGTLALQSGSIGGSGTIALGSYLDLTGTSSGQAAKTGVVLDFAAGAALAVGATAQTQAEALSLLNFAAGNDLVWAGGVTAASFAHGTLTLTNNGSQVGALRLQGSYHGESFVVVPSAYAGGPSEIVVAGAGDTTTAPSGTKSPDSYVWNGALSGSWDVAGDWTDSTTGLDPAGAAPGANDTVTVAQAPNPLNLPAPTVTVISGTGAAATLNLAGSTVLDGSFSAGALNVLTSFVQGTLYLLAGDTLAVSGVASLGQFAAVDLVGGDLSVGNALTIGSIGYGYGAAALTLSAGATLTADGLIAYNPVVITLDQTSGVAVGGGAVAAGVFGVAAGYDTVLAGALTAPTLALDGTIVVGGGSGLYLTLGTLTGSGTIDLGGILSGSGGFLSTDTAATIAFTGAGGTLSLAPGIAGTQTIAPTLAGFGAGDAIDWTAGGLTGTQFSHGTLSLLAAGGTAATLMLSGQYKGDTFLVLPQGSGQEVVLVGQGDTSTAPAGTSTPDSYVWQGGPIGSWDVAANWKDVTAGQNPASLAPGAADLVTLQGSGAQTNVISGVGNAATLTVQDSVLLFGQFGAGALVESGYNQTMSLDAGSTLAVSGAASIGVYDAVSVAGAGAVFTVAGTLSCAGPLFGSSAGLSALAGARVALGGLTTTGGVDFTVDATSAIEIGTAGHAPAGAFKIDPGASATVTGLISAPLLELNGTLIANGLTLQAGAASGNGTISVGTLFDAASGLAGGTGLTLAFANAAGTLAVGAGALDSAHAFDPAIAGFTEGDVIAWQGMAPTASSFAHGTLSLLDGAATLVSFDLGQLGAGLSPLVVPVVGGGSEILAVGAGNTATAPAGTKAAQAFQWTAGIVGSWDQAANWFDASTGQAASVAPGSHDSVTFGGGTSVYSVPQVITGVGNAATLTIEAPVLLDGAFTAAALVLGGAIFDTTASLSAGGTLAVAGAANLGFGETLVVDGATFSAASVTGVQGALLASNGASVTLGAVGSLGLVSLDAASSIEIGTRGGFAAGAFTVQVGASATLGGTLTAPTVVAGGVLTADDLTILAGTLTGQGTIAIVGTLSIAPDGVGPLAATALPTIAFGSDGALALQSADFRGGSFAPTLSGFGAGGAIFYDGSLTGAVLQNSQLVLQNGNRAVGTLTLAGSLAGARAVVVSPAYGPHEIVAVGQGDTTTAPAGTASADAYVWNGGYGGSWDAPASWSDVTAGQQIATLAPGANDTVGLGSYASEYGPTDVISGVGDAAGLSVIGNTELLGTIATGSLSYVNEGILLAIAAGATLAATGAVSIGYSDQLTASGAGAVFTDAGTLTVGDTAFFDYGTSFAVIAGATATLGGLAMGSGATVQVDAASSLTVGATAHAGLGTLAIGAGQIVGIDAASFGSGTIAAPHLVLNGILTGPVTIAANALSGGGQIDIANGTTDSFGNDGGVVAGGVGPTIAFTGGAGTLDLGSDSLTAARSLVPSVLGFGGGDVISWFGALTGTSYARGSGKLSLLDGTATVAVIQLVGSYTGETFGVSQDGGGGSVVSLVPASGNGGPSIAAPGTLTDAVGTATAVAGVSVSDVTGATYTAVLSDTLGALTANTSASGGGGTVSGSGSDTIVITGSLSQLNADLGTLRFQGSAAGSDTIAVSVNDGLGRVSDLAIGVAVEAGAVRGDLAIPHTILPAEEQTRPLWGAGRIGVNEHNWSDGHVFSHVL